MIKKSFLFLLILILFLLTKIVSMVVLAETDELPVLIVAASNQGVTFYEQATDGTLHAISEPLSNFAVESLGGTAEWLILSEESFAASPNGQYIAFTAQHENEAALFLYTIHGNDLIQHSVASYWLLPQWSPDSEAILLTPGNPYWSELPLPHDFVYEVAPDSLFQITFTEAREKAFNWTSDGNNLIYLGWCNPDNCGNPTNDLYVVSRNGSTRFPITDFPTALPPNTYIDVCHLAWDSNHQRWYYVVGCGGALDNPFTYIYSTDLSGDNQLEVDAEAYLRTTEGNGISFEYGIISGIHPRSDRIYFSVEFSFFADIDLHPELAGINLTEWRVLRLAGHGQHLETIYQQAYSSINNSAVQLSGSLMSPTGRYMVLLFYHSAIVVDLVNNQPVGVVPGLSTPEEKAVCDMRWLNNETLSYNVGGRECEYVNLTEPQASWMLNVVTNEVTILTDELTEPAWLLQF
jgi:hypothetical protein